MRLMFTIAVCGLVCILCACQPQVDRERPESAGGTGAVSGGVAVSLPATGSHDQGIVAVAADASNQNAEASATYAAPPSALAPVRLSSMDERAGMAARESLAGTRKMSAHDTFQRRNTREQRAIERYVGEDTSAGAARAARGPILMDAAKVAPRAAAQSAD